VKREVREPNKSEFEVQIDPQHGRTAGEIDSADTFVEDCGEQNRNDDGIRV
jgi:hypothetical protein